MSQSASCSGMAASEPAPREWLCAYVYTQAPLRDVLVGHAAPLIAEIMDGRLAERFFFIRYWEGGPHLRLRFQGELPLLMGGALPELEARFASWRESGVAERVEYVPYEPEVDRYGGPEAIGIAEECFELSSRVAIEILEEMDDDSARGAAMLLHAALAHVFGMTRAEAAEFFEGVARSRIPHEAALHDLVRHSFAPEAPRVVWDALEDGDEIEVPWLRRWIDGLRVIAARLDAARLTPSEISFGPPRFARRWMVLSSYIHMMNNRLGVISLDEPYLAFALSRVLR